MKNQLSEPFRFTKLGVGVIVTVIALALVMPSAIYATQLYKLQVEEQDLKKSLSKEVIEDVTTYVKETYLADNELEITSSGTDDNGVETGILYNTVPENVIIDSEELAKAVAEILTDEYISNIESDMLSTLYERIDAVVAEKVSQPSPSTGVTYNVDQAQVSAAVSAIVTQDLKQYKQELLNEVSSQNNLYSSISDAFGKTDSTVSALESDITTLSLVYDTKFSDLEAEDEALRTQISVLKAQNNQLQNEYNALSQKLLAANNDTEKVKSELQKRIDSLNTSSGKGDVELKNLLVKAQDDLNQTITTEDKKIYDNAVRIIALTDTITNMNTDMTSALETLSKESGEDVTALYRALEVLESDLSLTDATIANVSGSVSEEAAQRKADISELKALIESYGSIDSDSKLGLLHTINTKANELSENLESTSASMRNEYMVLISQLSGTVDENSIAIAAALEKTKKELEDSISATDEKLTKSINETNDNIDNVNESLNKTITDKSNDLDNKIDSSNKSLNDSINASNKQLSDSISATDEKLSKSIDDTNSNLSNVNESLSKTIDEKSGELDNKIKDSNRSLNESIDASNKQLSDSISATDEKLSKSIDDTNSNLANVNESLSKTINEKSMELDNKISDHNNTLSGSITKSNEELTAYIQSTNVETKEQLLEVIAQLQEEIASLQEQINELDGKKLNITDSTNYSRTVDVDGDTIRFSVPSTNPNFNQN